MSKQNMEEYDIYGDWPEEDPGYALDTLTVELMRLLQLESLLTEMQVEFLQTVIDEKPALQVFLDSDNGEISFFLSYHCINVDIGSFILEAILPMSIMENRSKALSFCMNYNIGSVASTAYWKEGRLFLRLIIKELEIPVDKTAVSHFFEDIRHEYTVFSMMI